ncbi:histidine phosphatase family protein [Paenibacillus polymyxa]|uniref:histidine phosphatase family protein n=1 Tax=Paenibacillus polymyxa TaxID=1406 RepID=UPI001BEC7CFC|nr:histidine phosphatase family protein [Paenibacillus polymyxa]MBT2282951.1 histidine phosphatase family protein [Paenibacillus polymyxa]
MDCDIFSPSTNILLIRHADFHNKHLTGGWTDTNITDIGIQQTEALAKKLSYETSIDVIISSTLKRAEETSRLLSDLLGVARILENRVKTINNGVLAWKTKQEARLMRIEDKLSNPEFKIDGGESLREFNERIVTVFNELISSYRHKTILIVTHGRVIQAICNHLTGGNESINLKYGVYPTAIMNLWMYDNNSVVFNKVNDTSHLPRNLLVSDLE